MIQKMNQLKGRFAARQILGGRAYQQDDYGLIERGDPDASLEEIATALIHAVEKTRHPCQDNTTVLLYKPEADFGEEMLPEKPREIEPETGLSRLWSGFKKILTKSSGQQSNLTS